ncbi:MAG: TRAP transporter substrate-binding protein [Desulfobacterium sp.]
MILLFSLISTTAFSKTHVIKLGLIAPMGHPVEIASNLFKKEVEQNSGGKIKVIVYPGEQLGGEIELQDQVALGTIQAANIGTPVMSAKHKKLDILNMYYLWNSVDHMNAVLNGPIGKILWEEYSAKSGVEVVSSNWLQGTRHTMTQKPVSVPADLKGIKIRVTAGVPLYNDLWKAMGANPVPLSFPEAYPSMKTGVVDAIELPFQWMVKAGFTDLGQYVDLTSHYIYTNVLIFNKRWLDKLDDNFQTIIRDAADKAGKFNTKLVLENEEVLKKKIEAKNIQFVSVDLKSFQDSVQPVYEKNMNIWGKELYQQIMEQGKVFE